MDHLYYHYSDSFSGRLPISSSFIWSGGFLPCSFICCVFLCLLILFNFLCLGSLFHRLQVRTSRCFWCLPPMGNVGSGACVGFLVEGSGACVLVGGAGSCPSGGQGWILSFWWAGPRLVVCFGMSVNSVYFRRPLCSWVGLCSCLASCLACVVQHWSLPAAGWSWVLLLRWRTLGKLSPIDMMWAWKVSGGLMSWTQFSHLRGSGLTHGQSTKTLPVTWLGRKGRKRRKKKKTEQIEPQTKW